MLEVVAEAGLESEAIDVASEDFLSPKTVRRFPIFAI
jgi:hypothetical protein